MLKNQKREKDFSTLLLQLSLTCNVVKIYCLQTSWFYQERNLTLGVHGVEPFDAIETEYFRNRERNNVLDKTETLSYASIKYSHSLLRIQGTLLIINTEVLQFVNRRNSPTRML